MQVTCITQYASKKDEARGKESGRGTDCYEVKVRIEWGLYDGMDWIRNKWEIGGRDSDIST